MANPFARKKVEESINDKMARLFKEGRSVDEIAKDLELKPDVVANVIRRKLGEDALPEKVVRSKNAVPHNEEVKLKAEDTQAPAADPAPEETGAEAPAEEASVEGLNKLEKFMFDKEKKKAENAPEEEPADPGLGVMEGISLDDASILEKLGGDQPAQTPAAEEDTAGDMAGIDTTEVDVSDIEEAPIAAYSEPDIVEEAPSAEPEPEAAAEPEPEPAPAPKPMPEMPHGNGSAFDKMKAFAKMQVAANNDKLAELESKLASVEGDYNARLETAEKDVAEAKTAYEEVIRKGDEISDRRDTLKNDHRTALARAEEEYRRKLAELDEEYNNATARANRELAEKQDKLNAESEQIDAQKEECKNDFLTKQREVNKIKDLIASEVDTVKAEIESLKEENKGYESFLN